MPPRRISARLSNSHDGTPQKGTPKPKATHKRQRSSNSLANTAASTPQKGKRARPSTSVGTAKATPKKSQYFEDPESDDNSAEGSLLADDDESAYDDDNSLASSPSQSDSEVASESSFEGRRKAKTGKQGSKGSSKSAVSSLVGKSKDLWREGVKAGLGPGRQVFIEKPKPRGDGGIKYTSDAIHPNTLAFLGDLKSNNDREWFKMHEPDFKASKADWDTFVDALSEKIQELDETIPELPPKDLVRGKAVFLSIRRDLTNSRFSGSTEMSGLAVIRRELCFLPIVLSKS